MKTRYWPLALVIGLGLEALVAAPAADPPKDKADAAKVSSEQIAKLVKQLSSEDFEEREKATKELEAVGARRWTLCATRPRTARSRSRRANAIIRKVEGKAANEKLLAPTKVKLSFKDTPLADAIAEFNKKSGYTIELHDPEKKLKDRTVTLDTGEVTFWEAFDKFCEKAGLIEPSMQDLMKFALPPGGPGGGVNPIRPLPPEKIPQIEKKEEKKQEKKDDGNKANPPAAEVKGIVPQAGGGGAAPLIGGPGGVVGGATIARPIINPFGMNPKVITVMDGKPKAVPTCYSGAVRIWALKENPNGMGLPVFPPVPVAPPGAGPGAAPAKDDMIMVWLEVRAEPKLQIQFLQTVAIDKATDDRDQKLEKVNPTAPGFPGGVPGGFGGGGAVPPVPPGVGGVRPAIARAPIGIGGFGGFGLGGVQTYPVMLKKGEKEAKALKAFAGTITAQSAQPGRTDHHG